MGKGQVVSFEMLMITTIMLVVMGLILPRLVTVKELVTEGESRQLAEKCLKVEMIYVMGEGAVMYEHVHAPSQIEFSGEGNEITVSTGGFSKSRNVSAQLTSFEFNVSGDVRITLRVQNGNVNLSSSP